MKRDLFYNMERCPEKFFTVHSRKHKVKMFT